MLDGALAADREALRGAAVPGRVVALRHPAVESGALLERPQRRPEGGLDAFLLRGVERLGRVAVADAARVLLHASVLGEPDRAVAVRAGETRDRARLRIVARPAIHLHEVVVAHEVRTVERGGRRAVRKSSEQLAELACGR